MIDLDRMQALEINSEWRGVSRRLLMENAGVKLAERIYDQVSGEGRVLIFAGTGNNGGDGFVAARHLINRGMEIGIVLLGKPGNIATGEAGENWEILSRMHLYSDFYIVRDSSDFQSLSVGECDVAVDAMLGTGIRGAPREPVASAIDYFNGLDSFKVAVDIPTGLDPDTGEVHESATGCDMTVTFHDTKPGLEEASEECTGEIVTAGIGIPKTAEVRAGPGDVRLAVPERERSSHKGQNGRLLIIGGGWSYVGAPGLAGLAALNAGVDLATIAVPSKVADVVNSYAPDLITLRLPGSYLSPEAVPDIEEALGISTAALIGPGLGSEAETEDAVIDLMELLAEGFPDLPVLLDADGLKFASGRPDLLREGNFVVTPHAGEFEILAGDSISTDLEARIQEVSEKAKELGTPILLKAEKDICADEDGTTILNDTGNPGMTVGGTGDVLGGIVSAFLSKGIEPFRAMTAGAFLCGLAGDICEEGEGYEFTASDVKDKIPIAISRARKYW